MSIWNKILIGFIFVASLVFFFFGARTLKTHAVWKKCIADHEHALELVRDKNAKLVDGDAGQPGIRQIRLELEQLAASRTRIWSGCRPGPMADPAAVNKDGLMVTVESPNPHRIAANSVVYVFDEADFQQGGRYLGKFTVPRVAERQANLVPAYTMTQSEFDRLRAARGTWSLWENLPPDDNQMFAELDEAAKKALLPKETVAEYLQDVNENGEWKRKLRDYRVLFDLHYRSRADTIKQLQIAAVDLATQKASNDGQTEQGKFLDKQKGDMTAELAKVQGELKVVSDYKNALDADLANAKSAVENTDKQNEAVAARLGQAQREALRRWEEKAQRIARAAGDQ